MSSPKPPEFQKKTLSLEVNTGSILVAPLKNFLPTPLVLKQILPQNKKTNETQNTKLTVFVFVMHA